MASTSAKTGRGKSYSGQSQEIIFRVCDYFMSNVRNSEGQYLNISDLYKLTAEATGVSKCTIQRIITGFRKVAQSEPAARPTFSTPSKKRPRPSKKSNVDNFEKGIIRRCLYNFLLEHKTLPTIRMVHEVLKRDINYNGGITSLTACIRKIGFRGKRRIKNRLLLIEKSDIRMKRSTYLAQIQEYRKQGRPIVYSSETYIHSTFKPQRKATENTNNGGKVPSKGKNTITIIHACNIKGFLPNTLLTLVSQEKIGEHHVSMNVNNYSKWIQEKFVPNLQPNSVVVIDDACHTYHNKIIEKVPTSNSKEAEMLAWLQKHNISYPTKYTKPILYNIVKANIPQCKQYILDKLLESHGHLVLRLPRYHPELNPIEHCWVIVKERVATQNITTLDSIQSLLECEINGIGEQTLKDIYIKVKEKEQEYELLEAQIDKFTDECTNAEDSPNDDSPIESSSGASSVESDLSEHSENSDTD